MGAHYDVIQLGAGAPGEHCAARLAAGGLRVAVVERELVGGECSYWACIPSKTLLRPGEALADALRAPGARESVDGRVDVASALGWRDYMVSGYDDSGQAGWLEREGIELLRGQGRIAGPRTVEVDGERFTASHIVVATGAEPRIPPLPGLEELEHVWTNREATGVTDVPARLLVLGGGPVGVEMAQALVRMGAAVTLVQGSERLLPREPAPVGEALAVALRAEGVELRLGQRPAAVRPDGDGCALVLPDASELGGDELLVATGRIPRSDGIGLETVGIEPDERGAIPVDERMAAGEGIWAIGDVTGIWPLTYVGKYQGRIAASNILGRPARASYDAVPRVVFTDPQAAAVGAAEGHVHATVSLADVPRTATYVRDYADRPGFLTLVSDGERLTGAHAVGPEAGEWLQQATLAIRARVPLEVMRDTIQPFPTFSEAFLHALGELPLGD